MIWHQKRDPPSHGMRLVMVGRCASPPTWLFETAGRGSTQRLEQSSREVDPFGGHRFGVRCQLRRAQHQRLTTRKEGASG